MQLSRSHQGRAATLAAISEMRTLEAACLSERTYARAHGCKCTAATTRPHPHGCESTGRARQVAPRQLHRLCGAASHASLLGWKQKPSTLAVLYLRAGAAAPWKRFQFRE